MESGTAKTAFPLFVRLDGARVVVVGAGDVAARKVNDLVTQGARITVVAPEACDGIRKLARTGAISWERRSYQLGDLAGALLCVVATSDRSVNEAAYAEASASSILVNVVDVPDLCTCIVPSVLRRGRLQIAVSTGGAAPAVARDIRHRLEEEFPGWWEDYLDLMAEVRAIVKQRVPGPSRARTPLYEALAASDLEDRLASGERPCAQDVYDDVVAPLLGGDAQ